MINFNPIDNQDPNSRINLSSANNIKPDELAPLTGANLHLAREYVNIKENIHTRTDLTGVAEEIRKNYLRAGTKSALVSLASSITLSSIAVPVMWKALKVLGAIHVGHWMGAGLIAGAGTGQFMAGKLGKKISEKYPALAGSMIGIGVGTACTGFAIGFGALVGATGGLGFGAATWIGWGASVGPMKLSLTLIEPWSGKVFGGGTHEKMQEKIIELGRLTPSLATEAKVMKQTHQVQRVFKDKKQCAEILSNMNKTELTETLKKETINDEIKDLLSPSQKGYLWTTTDEERRKPENIADQLNWKDSEELEEILKDLSGNELLILMNALPNTIIENVYYREIGLDELEKQGLSRKNVDQLIKYAHKPVTSVADYFYNNIFSPPIHPDLIKVGTLGYLQPQGKEQTTPEQTTPEQTISLRRIQLLSEKSKATSKQKETVASSEETTPFSFTQTAASAQRISYRVFVSGPYASFKETKKAFTPGKNVTGSAWETVKNTGHVLVHSTQTTLHRITFQVFRKYGPIGRALQKNPAEATKKRIEVFETVTSLANNGKFANSAEAHENFKQMVRRFGVGVFEKNDELKAEVAKAEKAIIENYGPDRSIMELLTFDLTQQWRAEEIYNKIPETSTTPNNT
jgi:hypothetical protein